MYGASKTFVVSFSELLAREVRRHGVKVTAVCPGLTRSEFHQASGMADSVRGLPAWLWMDASTVARQGFDASSSGTPVYINGRINRLCVALFRYVPMPLVAAAKGGKRSETSKCPPAADGSPAPYYRIFEVWFDNQADMTEITATPEWKKLVADVPNFATGGITRVVSKLD
jgi:uncharacterized protein (TIGR02118 family)